MTQPLQLRGVVLTGVDLRHAHTGANQGTGFEDVHEFKLRQVELVADRFQVDGLAASHAL